MAKYKSTPAQRRKQKLYRKKNKRKIASQAKKRKGKPVNRKRAMAMKKARKKSGGWGK